MSLPLTTTTVTIQRPRTGVDPYEDQSYITVVSGHPAVISQPSGSGLNIGGIQETISATLLSDPVDCRRYDIVTDETTGRVYDVTWSNQRYELGLAHTKAGLTFTEGAAQNA